MRHLGQVIAAYQQKYDVPGNVLAVEIGIEESCLTRIKQGRLPDASGLVRIMSWLLRSPATRPADQRPADGGE